MVITGTARSIAPGLREKTVLCYRAWKQTIWFGVTWTCGVTGKRRMKKEVFAELERILDERLRSSEEPDDNLTAIIKASRETGQTVSRWELINTIYLILLAGIHNTSNLIHWCLLYLSSDPAWARELRDELSQWDTANFKGMNQFPRLKATIQEVQRLRLGAIIHRLTAARDFEFDGYLVPRGAEIIHVNTLVHFLDSV